MDDKSKALGLIITSAMMIPEPREKPPRPICKRKLAKKKCKYSGRCDGYNSSCTKRL